MKLFLTNFIILSLSFFFIFMNFLYNDADKITTFKENVDIFYKTDRIEVYSKVSVRDVISLRDYIIIDEIIEPLEVGNNDFIFKYVDGKRVKKGVFHINVVDTDAPYIALGSSYSVNVNSSDNFKDNILCIDNYDDFIDCNISGIYDLNKVGEYPLEFTATDKSGNINSKKFTLKVKEKSNGFGNSSKVYVFDDIVSKYKTDSNKIGIDISKWQGDIDFNKVRDSGVSFVMIRIGTQNGLGGKSIIDPKFKEYIEGAINASLDIGVYFYSYASSNEEIDEQVKFVVDNLAPYKDNINLPVVFDFECFKYVSRFNISMYNLNKLADRFLDKIKSYGYSVMLYGSKNYLENIWKYTDKDIWLAHYTENTNYNGKYMMWQLTNSGKVDGIKEKVDIDILYLES